MATTIKHKGKYQIGEMVVFRQGREVLEGTINSITKLDEEIRLEIKVSRTRFVRISTDQIIQEY